MSRKRVLFIAEAVTLAHVARPLVLAQALHPHHYKVYLACDPRYNHLFPDLPLTQVGIRSVSSDRFIDALAKGKPLYDEQTLRDYVAEDIGIIEEVAPDLIVGDFRLSLAVSAPLSGVPYMTISNIYWSPFSQQHWPVPELPMTRILGVTMSQALFSLSRPAAFALHTIPLNRVRREQGLAALGWDLRRVYTWADHTLYADAPGLVSTIDLPANHHYLGPVLWSPSVVSPVWWEQLPSDKPIIYVTLGSSGRSDLLLMVLRALADSRVTVIAATAGRVVVDQAPANAYLADFIPGDAAVARSRLVICNGGSPTTQQALAQGLPVLGIPSNLDQHLNMNAVCKRGAGELIRSEQASISSIRESTMRLLETPAYRRSATEVSSTFAQYNAQKRFVELVGEVL